MERRSDGERPLNIEVFYSYACRDSYLAFRWLRSAQAVDRELRVSWRPFAIEIDDPERYWDRPWDEAASELKGFVAAQAAGRQGEEAFERFHDSLEAAVHEELLELGDEETIMGAARQAGLNLEAFRAAIREERLAGDVKRSHERGQELGIFGTPTVIFPNSAGLHLELSHIPPAEEASAVFQCISTLGSELPYVDQLKRIGS